LKLHFGQNSVFIEIPIDVADLRRHEDGLRKLLQPLAAQAAKAAGTGDSDRQLIEAERAAALADARVAEIEARRRTCELEADAKRLVAVNRELATAQASAAEAAELLAAAKQINARRRDADAADHAEREGKLIAAARKILDDERRLIEDADAVNQVAITKLAAVTLVSQKMTFGLTALRNFTAGY
jgi:hypothetical protein